MVPRGKGWGRRRAGAALFLLVLFATQALSSASARWVDGVRIPSGYRLIGRHHPGTGVWHLVLQRRHPGEVLNVALLERGSPNRLQVLLSNGLVAGPKPRTERTSSMCRRADCLVAINGDFFTNSGAPVGGVVSDGEPIRSPVDSRRQFLTGPSGTPRVGDLQMTTTLVSYYPTVPAGLLRKSQPPQGHSLNIDGVNVTRGSDDVVLYTPRFAPTTET